MGNIYQHKFTWLKVAAAAYLAEMLLFGLLIGFDVFREAGSYIYILFLVGAGLLAGFALNLVCRYRRTVATYIAGHVLSCLAFVGYIAYYQRQNTPEPLNSHHHWKETIDASGDSISALIGSGNANASEKVLFDMEQRYPLGAYEWGLMATEPAKGDTSGRSGTICYIVYRLPEEDNRKYLNKYFVLGDSIAILYNKKDTASLEYRQFERHRSNYDTLFTELPH
ncbi:MAG: hypothetical protein JNL72_15830 [Flavipsychrobacter sp.]|nr:hypothetical protein [Flavipsychrobacter sp.]